MDGNGSKETTRPTASAQSGFTAPYAPFAALLRLVERMADEGGAPARVDRSYLSLSDLPPAPRRS